MNFEGIYTPLVTPFSNNFDIEKDRFADIIELLISAGVHGLIVAGTTGEYYAQSAEERVQLMKLAKDIGADGLLVATPPYAYPTGREIALHALAILCHQRKLG